MIGTSVMMPTLATPEGMPEEDSELLNQCLESWSRHRTKNVLRNAYYAGDQLLSNLNIAVPDVLAHQIGPVVNWPKKVVHSLSHRVVFEGFTYDGEEDRDPYGLHAVMDSTEFLLEVKQGVISSMIHGVSFMSITDGDMSAGDPDMVVPMVHSGDMSGAVWSRRRRRLDAFVAVAALDNFGAPSELRFFTTETIYKLEKPERDKAWVISSAAPHGISRIPVEPLRYQPELAAPLGQSRVSKAVRDITDRAVRTVLRSEITSEIYSGPNIAIVGADEETFKDSNGQPIPAWKFSLSKMLEIPLNELDEKPDLKQLQQATMQPHHEMLRMQAEQLSSETNVPISSLGIVQENPSSAQAIYAAKEDLVIEAADAIVVYKRALENAAHLILEMRDGSSPESDRIQGKFKNPATPSIVSTSDAMVKQIGAIPWLAETDVALEELGYTPQQIQRLLTQKKRLEGEGRLQSLLERAGQRQQGSGDPDTSNDPRARLEMNAARIESNDGLDS